ncbi:Ethanolamine-phosphate cytidylyltransferase [Hibiscus syriacus]|uniref:Ethanolamine-phosphate cytidylyltransferase n=1 Tax=Hibiscus syriacus TaxID=106335 RepID=A0A6A3B497_HIBSY|nr:Ethanolamine-phosphate cytidylyltransferase [Hibiscus syriacus]
MNGVREPQLDLDGLYYCPRLFGGLMLTAALLGLSTTYFGGIGHFPLSYVWSDSGVFHKKKCEKKRIRVYMDGCFDLMHYGHANALRQAKALGDELVVGVVSDEEIIANKALLFFPWKREQFMNSLFNKHKIDYIHGDDPCLLPDGSDAYALAKKAGRYKQIKRTEGVSSTDIVGERHQSQRGQISQFLPTSQRIVQFSNGKFGGGSSGQDKGVKDCGINPKTGRYVEIGPKQIGFMGEEVKENNKELEDWAKGDKGCKSKKAISNPMGKRCRRWRLGYQVSKGLSISKTSEGVRGCGRFVRVYKVETRRGQVKELTGSGQIQNTSTGHIKSSFSPTRGGRPVYYFKEPKIIQKEEKRLNLRCFGKCRSVYSLFSEGREAFMDKIRKMEEGAGVVNEAEEEKEEFFSQLLSFVHSIDLPLCIGEISMLISNKRKDWASQNWHSMGLLRNFLQQPNLIDLPLVGGTFTWGSNREVTTWEPKNVSRNGQSEVKGISEAITGLESKIYDMEIKAQSSGLSTLDWEQLLSSRNELWKLHRIEESIWFQLSREKWIKDGDRNTRFFHLCAVNRNRFNTISELKVDGEVLTDPEVIKVAVSQFFKKAYNSKDFLEVENLNLNFDILREEQRTGLEGHLMKFMEDFYYGRKWDHGVNHAFISLIPKKGNLECIEDYRPISLVGSLYKIISKVLARRLFSVIQDIVSPSQFAFIPGRQLLDCAFIANEGIDSWRKRGLKGVVFKADFQRAYDSVEWPIIFRLLRVMGFGERWVSWMICCLSTASISVLVNGSPTEEFSMGKGLRQGCSLSPLLFNLVGELLNRMLMKAADVGLFQGFTFGRSDALSLTHLQFADDLIVFCRDSSTYILNIKRVLRTFSIMTGLHLNMSKSNLYGINVEGEVLNEYAKEIGCAVGVLPTVYLGLPLGAKRNLEALWEPVMQSFNKKLSGWKASSLSMAGRLVLIKSVLSSLPIFFLSIFRIPSKVYRKLNSIMANFLWGEGSSKSRIHWVNWKRVCLPVEEGGLGILDLNFANRVLLGNLSFGFLDMEGYYKKLLGRAIGNGLRSHSKIQVGGSLTWKKFVWSGLAPPRVETFLWQVSHQRLAVRSELIKRGVTLEEVSCPLLLSRRKQFSICLFRVSLFAVLLVGFKAKVINMELYTGETRRSQTRHPKRMKVQEWLPPPLPFFKVNVDGAISGDGLLGGMGGILRDSESKILGSFSLAVGPGPPPLAEMKAIEKGIEFFLSSEWVTQGRLIIESDCKTVVDWILLPTSSPPFLSLLVQKLLP